MKNKRNQHGEKKMDEQLHCRITSEDKERIEAKADSLGMKVCAFVKTTVMDRVNK